MHAHVAWLADLYPGRHTLNPLEPDRLGEVLVADVLAAQGDAGQALLSGVLELPNDAQVTRYLETMTRVIADHAAPRDLFAAAMDAEVLARLVTRAEQQSRGNLEIPGTQAYRAGQTTLAAALDRVLLSGLADRIEALPRAEPANTGYQRDVSVSYIKLADLAVARGEGARAEELYTKGLAIAEALGRAEPANTGYQRDVSVSYERLAEIARTRGEPTQAAELYRTAVSRRKAVVTREPGRVDLAEELAVALALSAMVLVDPAIPTGVMALLAPFEAAGTLTAKGSAVLEWARREAAPS